MVENLGLVGEEKFRGHRRERRNGSAGEGSFAGAGSLKRRGLIARADGERGSGDGAEILLA